MASKHFKLILKSLKNFAIAYFFGWLIFSPVPGENTNQPKQSKQPIEKILSITGGNQENSSPIQLPPSTSSSTQSGSESKVASSKSNSFSTGSERVTFKSSGSSSPSGNDDDDFDLTIGTKKWERWVCPDPDEIISNPEFWTKLKEESETCLIDEEIEKENKDSSKEMETESTPQRQRRRRLLAVPNTPPLANPTPTRQLDQQIIEKYDLTTKKIQPFQYYSREGILLSGDHRSVRKLIYGHAPELELPDLMSRIPCPTQSDPDKFSRVDCWATTDANLKEALVKIFERTTSVDPNIVTVEMPMHENPAQRATYFIDKTTGSSIYFHKGGKQDGKLWSGASFNPAVIPKMLEQPETIVITDLSNKNNEL